MDWIETKAGQEWESQIKDPEWGIIWRREVRKRDTRFSRIPLPDDDELVRVEFCWQFEYGSSGEPSPYAVPGLSAGSGQEPTLEQAKETFARCYMAKSVLREVI